MILLFWFWFQKLSFRRLGASGYRKNLASIRTRVSFPGLETKWLSTLLNTNLNNGQKYYNYYTLGKVVQKTDKKPFPFFCYSFFFILIFQRSLSSGGGLEMVLGYHQDNPRKIMLRPDGFYGLIFSSSHPDLLRSREALTRISISQKVIIDNGKKPLKRRHFLLSSRHTRSPCMILLYFSSWFLLSFRKIQNGDGLNFFMAGLQISLKKLDNKRCDNQVSARAEKMCTKQQCSIVNCEPSFLFLELNKSHISHKAWGYWAAKNV